ncbi:hypothetical protein LTR28_004333 [Elasticomyces elasticus]|nr:hypothetical protein LTR28_004333 [Elasticomyces elasticus]
MSPLAISSKLLPFVSASTKQAKKAIAASAPAQKRKVPQPRSRIMYGVAREKTKLKSHCDATASAVPGSRVRDGNSSATYGHGSGPQEKLYAMTKR